ncbi:hypothetical protein [Sphingomonas parapaucimobilis]|uniref:hypothetical protein n=1 Tax=Sphingomonas parapaucimobilis TaxID=28213 RepID=UPI0035C7C673
MITHRAAFTIAIIGALISQFAATPTPVSVLVTIMALAGAVVAWMLAERQAKEINQLSGLVDEVQSRPRVEHSASAAIIAQGELATWNYDQLVERLRNDSRLISPNAS